MLVLSRNEFERTQESIFIGPDVQIVILKAARGKARIGIIAPPEVEVRRSEHLEAPRQPPVAEAVTDA